MTVDPATPPPDESVALSVVIITENEADNVDACIESVFAACRGVDSFEVILVDSASTDDTVTRAADHPITVLRIPTDHVVSCGAGRYVGDRVARGELVLHVDGDMVLTDEWLPQAIDQLGEPGVAAVEGTFEATGQTQVREVDKVGGVMLYDAAALRAVGGFDPYLLGYEDVEVGYRLREAGYRLLRLPTVSATHREGEGSLGPVDRWRQGYMVAPGQAIRKWVGSPAMLRRLLARQRYKVALLAWLCVGLAAVVSLPLLLGWLVASAAGFGYLASRRGVRGAVRFLLTKTLGVAGLAAGLRRSTPPAEAYPVETVEVVREGPVHGGGRDPAEEATPGGRTAGE